MRLVVGLGNPGIRYRWSRHNLGFWVLDRLGKKTGISINLSKFNSLVGEGFIDAEKIVLVKPLTYMNLSGKAVGAVVRGYRAKPEELIICCDDAALPLGRIRIREKGGHGGHKGLRSIIEALRTEEFPRLRIGIAKSTGAGSLADYVLAGFSGKEKPAIKEAVESAREAVELIISQGIAVAMNQYNPKG